VSVTFLRKLRHRLLETRGLLLIDPGHHRIFFNPFLRNLDPDHEGFAALAHRESYRFALASPPQSFAEDAKA
jgi:hypothetical protein